VTSSGAVQWARGAAGRFARFYWDSGLSADVPALAWYLVAACAPLALGLAALATIILGDAGQAEMVATRMARLLPRDVHDQVVLLILRTRRDSPLLLAVAVGTMVWASAGATGVIERVESRLLGTPRPGALALKLRHVSLAAGMVALISLMAIAATEATHLRERLGVTIPAWALSVGSAVVTVALCTLVYRFATPHRVVWRAALLGAIPATFILQVTPLIAGYYARAVVGRTPVTLFLVLGGLLFTCYLVAQGLLIGAGLAVEVERRTVQDDRR
jgi:uncharacterized BrkB/YihY/UPF0761 family membrane protein